MSGNEPAPTLGYEPAKARTRWWYSWWSSTAGFLLAPFVVAAAYTILSRWPVRVWTTRSDYMFEGIACVAGLPFALRLPVPLWVRMLVFLFYALLVSLVIEAYMLYVIGYVFDDWL